MNKLNGKNVYLLRDNSTEYTTLLAKYFEEAFTKGGGQIIAAAMTTSRATSRSPRRSPS